MVADNIRLIPHVLQALLQDRLGKDHCCCGAITYLVVGLDGDFAHHSCAQVLNLIYEEYVFGDSNPIVGYDWGTATHANDNLPATWA